MYAFLATVSPPAVIREPVVVQKESIESSALIMPPVVIFLVTTKLLSVELDAAAVEVVMSVSDQLQVLPRTFSFLFIPTLPSKTALLLPVVVNSEVSKLKNLLKLLRLPTFRIAPIYAFLATAKPPAILSTAAIEKDASVVENQVISPNVVAVPPEVKLPPMFKFSVIPTALTAIKQPLIELTLDELSGCY